MELEKKQNGRKPATTANADIRSRSAQESIPLWMIAEEMHISASRFSILLRRELSQEAKAQIYGAIDRIKERSA